MSEKDLAAIASVSFVPWDELRSKKIFITGATGLIGFHVVTALLYANKVKGLDLQIFAFVRDMERANRRFEAWREEIGTALHFIVGTVEEFPAIDENIDFIIHGASETSSREFVEHPVETISTALSGTKNVLEMARQKNVAGLVYLSSMEMYGHPERGHKVTEVEVSPLMPLEIRNSYPISKLQSENLCCAYAKECHVPAMILRLTQTYGPEVNDNDNRIFAYFGQCVKEKKDIVLKTTGESERNYLFVADAVTAVLTVLLKGTPGEAYNVADEDSYCSIAEMAERVAKKYNLKVRYEIADSETEGYPEAVYINLDTTRLKKLGWEVMRGD